MPIKNIPLAQKQGNLFTQKLSIELNSNNKLYKLRSLIDWDHLEKWLHENVKINKLGRDRKCHRVMLGLLMLQAMYNFSDGLTSEELTENMYWQYFCGYEQIESNIKISESSIRRFRNLLGEDGLNEILKELIRVGRKTGLVKKKDLTSIIVDTTVQPKNIKHPHDAYLMGKAREEIVKLCCQNGVYLNETYAKTYKFSTLKLWRYKKDSKSKLRSKLMKKLKTLLGRLIRIFERYLLKTGINLNDQDQVKLENIKKIHAQSALKSSEKKEYKKETDIVYSFHAPEVRCIGKGKLHKPFEFGNKVSIAVSGRNNFILCAKSFDNNPYDGHTLKQTFEEVEKITQTSISKAFVDLGYRGSNVKEKGKIYIAKTKKKLKSEDKKMIKRRSAIEPMIGHMKQYGRMGRNFLRGKIGDIINPIISGIGLNLRNIANYLLKNPALISP